MDYTRSPKTTSTKSKYFRSNSNSTNTYALSKSKSVYQLIKPSIDIEDQILKTKSAINQKNADYHSLKIAYNKLQTELEIAYKTIDDIITEANKNLLSQGEDFISNDDILKYNDDTFIIKASMNISHATVHKVKTQLKSRQAKNELLKLKAEIKHKENMINTLQLNNKSMKYKELDINYAKKLQELIDVNDNIMKITVSYEEYNDVLAKMHKENEKMNELKKEKKALIKQVEDTKKENDTLDQCIYDMNKRYKAKESVLRRVDKEKNDKHKLLRSLKECNKVYIQREKERQEEEEYNKELRSSADEDDDDDDHIIKTEKKNEERINKEHNELTKKYNALLQENSDLLEKLQQVKNKRKRYINMEHLYSENTQLKTDIKKLTYKIQSLEDAIHKAQAHKQQQSPSQESNFFLTGQSQHNIYI